MEDRSSLEIFNREFQLKQLSQLGNSGQDKTNLSQLHHLQLTTGQSILSQVLYNSETVPHGLSTLNITDNKLQPPSIYSHLPHMIGKPESLVPNIKASQGRTGVSLVFGIPTVKRSAKSYLIETIHSLINGLSDEERADALLILMVSEPTDDAFVNQVYDDVKQNFLDHLNSGLLEIMAPRYSFYPDFNNIKETLGDSKIRCKWRRKQNLDFSYLMMYAQSRGRYYCQMEDDVIAKPGYFAAMKAFAQNQTTDDWILLEFSRLGFIGKLFKTTDIPSVSQFFLMFYQTKPVDWLIDHYIFDRLCTFGNPQHCKQETQSARIRYKPSLFQHMGYQSSLLGKIQPLKDSDF